MSKPHNATNHPVDHLSIMNPAETKNFVEAGFFEVAGVKYKREQLTVAAMYRSRAGVPDPVAVSVDSEPEPEAEDIDLGLGVDVGTDTPDDSWLKADIVDWLNEHEGVEANTGMTKADLLAMVEQVLTTE